MYIKFDSYIGNLFYIIFIITFLFHNSKLILIYTSDIPLNKKIDMISSNDIIYGEPILYSFLITIIYLVLNLTFYYLTLNYNKLKEHIKKEYLSRKEETQKLKEEIQKLKKEKELNELKQEIILINKDSVKKQKIKNKGYRN